MRPATAERFSRRPEIRNVSPMRLIYVRRGIPSRGVCAIIPQHRMEPRGAGADKYSNKSHASVTEIVPRGAKKNFGARSAQPISRPISDRCGASPPMPAVDAKMCGRFLPPEGRQQREGRSMSLDRPSFIVTGPSAENPAAIGTFPPHTERQHRCPTRHPAMRHPLDAAPRYAHAIAVPDCRAPRC